MSLSCRLRVGIVNELTGLRVVLVRVNPSWPDANVAMEAKIMMSLILWLDDETRNETELGLFKSLYSAFFRKKTLWSNNGPLKPTIKK